MMRTLIKTVSTKYAHKSFASLIMLVGVLLWLALFIGGLIGYPGSKLIYTLFSAVSLAMLASGFYRQVSYGYLFLVIFLWLGFWFKLTIHMIFDYPYGEPIGYFNGTATAWNEVLWVAITASLGAVIGRALYGFADRKATMLIPGDGFTAPVWYPAIRKWLWIIMLAATIGLAIINAVYGILQIGLVPRTILLWPFNAVISWLVGIGLAMGIVALLWWDMSLKKDVSFTAYAILAEAFCSSISVLSRATYIFHSIPQIVAFYKNRWKLIDVSKKKIVIAAFVFVSLFFVSQSVVNTFRSYLYQHYGSFRIDVVSSPILLRLATDRWIGIEGIMAVASHPEKGAGVLLAATTENREIGKISSYQRVCNSIYQKADNSKYQFASLPGAAAFLYYSDSLGVVMFGMAIFAVLILFSERLVFVLTTNPLLCSLYGLTAANTVAQFGLAPRQAGPYFFMIFCVVLAIWFVQSGFFSKVLQKFNALISVKKGI